MTKGEAETFEDGREVGEHTIGLLLDTGADNRGGEGIDGCLPRAEQQASNTNGVRVGTDDAGRPWDVVELHGP